ncbi:nickel pincer cofactor biosynthesis protein LarB [Paenibacillus sp. IB182496]|uniref:Nickel pincer cofactor biosynthesis protein LarB n=1 Tax=Paenibacillus sabuli TaxID=2772509 RepID=A0A927BWC2_9BACL|nr:nickel pincer cofactor biosynthesis protein LarB [Paenibacillus sabuli]MBD2848052.1 nickel pincer cofactor biosynthesis protein LarB [Paenibacillus sabuli]
MRKTFEDLEFSKVDIGREQRTGHPEVIFGQGKTVEHVVRIFATLVEAHGRAMVTRATRDMAEAVRASYAQARYDAVSGLITCGVRGKFDGKALVLSAGTSDIPIAEEAVGTADWLGCHVEKRYDVGVAGIDRLLAYRDQIAEASVVIVVAGMEGALASVVGGMTRRPVIAVPTSIGYGAHFQGLTPLLGMLTSCAAGVSVVNIDNGFGAGYNASTILQLMTEAKRS